MEEMRSLTQTFLGFCFRRFRDGQQPLHDPRLREMRRLLPHAALHYLSSYRRPEGCSTETMESAHHSLKEYAKSVEEHFPSAARYDLHQLVCW